MLKKWGIENQKGKVCMEECDFGVHCRNFFTTKTCKDIFLKYTGHELVVAKDWTPKEEGLIIKNLLLKKIRMKRF